QFAAIGPGSVNSGNDGHSERTEASTCRDVAGRLNRCQRGSDDLIERRVFSLSPGRTAVGGFSDGRANARQRRRTVRGTPAPQHLQRELGKDLREAVPLTTRGLVVDPPLVGSGVKL